MARSSPSSTRWLHTPGGEAEAGSGAGVNQSLAAPTHVYQNLIWTSILTATGVPFNVAGANFHFARAAKALASPSGVSDRTTLASRTIPSVPMMHATTTTPSRKCLKRFGSGVWIGRGGLTSPPMRYTFTSVGIGRSSGAAAGCCSCAAKQAQRVRIRPRAGNFVAFAIVSRRQSYLASTFFADD
jgi:hypothetical protein